METAIKDQPRSAYMSPSSQLCKDAFILQIVLVLLSKMNPNQYQWLGGQPLGSQEVPTAQAMNAMLNSAQAQIPSGLPNPGWFVSSSDGGGFGGPNGFSYYLPPLPRYPPPTPTYLSIAPSTPANITPTPHPLQPVTPRQPTHSPAAPSPANASVTPDENELASQVNLANFSFNFQVWIQIGKTDKPKKAKFKNKTGNNIRLPPGSTLVGLNLGSFKKLLASACMHSGYPMKHVIWQCEQDRSLKWRFHFNGAPAFCRADDVEVTTDKHFKAWVHACAFAGPKTMGVRISMLNPAAAQGQKDVNTAILSSLKRANCQFILSSEGFPDDEASNEDTDSDITLKEDPEQAVMTAISDIRQMLCGGHSLSEEVPQWIDPKYPRHIIAMTPQHLKVWGQDYIAKTPGVSLTAPPLNRCKFKSTKRTMGLLAGLNAESPIPLRQTKVMRTAFNPMGPEERQALALKVDVSIEDFLHFAKIKDAALVVKTLDQLNELGIDSWFVFKDPKCATELRALGMQYGTVQKLILAASAYKTLLANGEIHEYNCRPKQVDPHAASTVASGSQNVFN